MGLDLPQVEQAPIEDFCIDERCCPERLPTPAFPSPTSCLPLETLEQLEEEIEEANQFLLDLALDDERTSDEIFRDAFSGLEGLMVEISRKTGKVIKGKVHTVGFDFVVILDEEVEIILPYREIIKVKPSGRFAEPDDEAQLLNIDACLRRDITFHFGKVVASSPELLNVFFRMRLNIYLLLLESKNVKVSLDDTVIEGLVKKVHKETITIKSGNESNDISINNISMVKIARDL